MTVDESRARYVEGITRLLVAGEQVRAVAQVRAGDGLTPAPPAQPSAPPATGGPGFLGALLAVLSPNITFGRADNAVDWLLFGVGGRGEPGSSASVLHHALTVAAKGPGLRNLVLGVTDQRLLLGFADGSWLSFHVPLADSSRPLREIAAALSAG